MADLVVTGADLGPGPRQRIRITGGTITAVSPDLEVGPGDEVLDAAGGAVLPGLHDHHVHLYAAAAARRSVPLGPPEVPDPRRFDAALAEADRRLPDGAWIRGVGYHEAVAGPLTRRRIDEVVSDRPVRIQHRSGSRWFLNSRALDALGVDALGARGVERDGAGAPTGVLVRMDRWLDDALERGPLPLGEVGEEAARRGVTGFTDATPVTGSEQLARLADAVHRGELPQRVSAMTAPGMGHAPDGLSLGPVKVVLDDDALDDAALRAAVRDARREARPVAVHCVTAAQAALTAAVLAEVGGARRDRIEHGSVLPLDLLPTLAALGVTVVTNPGFLHDRGDAYAAEVEGPDRDDLYRVASLVAAGVGLAGGTDAPHGPGDPWAAARAAVERRSRGGAVLGAGERVDGAAALSLFLGPADDPARPRAVRPGTVGDLCVMATPWPETLRTLSADVAATVIGGEVLGQR